MAAQFILGSSQPASCGSSVVDGDDYASGSELITRPEIAVTDARDGASGPGTPRALRSGGGTRGSGPGTVSPTASPRSPSNPLVIRQVPEAEVRYSLHRREPKLIGRFLIGDTLGEGSSGKVKEGMDAHNLRRVAVKILKYKRLKRLPNGLQNVRREIEILKRIRHRNVIDLIDVLVNDAKQKMYMVMEYCPGDLQETVSQAPEGRLPLWQAHHYFVQLIEGLEYLHGRGIIHRDIKPSNLLITFDYELKITDFGVSDRLDPFVQSDACSSSLGTLAFQPPEIALGKESFSGRMVDLWAAGVTLYHMTTGKFPFEGESVYQIVERVGKGVYPLPPPVAENKNLRDLVTGIMDPDPSTRFSIDVIKKTAWFCSDLGPGSSAPARACRRHLLAPMSSSGSNDSRSLLRVVNRQSNISSQSKVSEDIYGLAGPGGTTMLPYLENLYQGQLETMAEIGKRMVKEVRAEAGAQGSERPVIEMQDGSEGVVSQITAAISDLMLPDRWKVRRADVRPYVGGSQQGCTQQ